MVLFDPLSGNSIVNNLNSNLRKDAKDQINIALAEGLRNKSKQRRRRELAGARATVVDEGQFKMHGSLEERSNYS